MKTLIVIPARYASSRFPAKVIAPLLGKPIIQWVWEKAQASRLADRVLIAADDQRVIDIVRNFGGEAVMTRPDHPSGTDRIHEAIAATDAELIINVQGDEPMIPPTIIDDLIRTMQNHPEIPMGTVAVECKRADVEHDPNTVKVVVNTCGQALYFSRSMIPFLRSGGIDMPVYRHWGIYAYQRAALEKFVALPEGHLERCEKLEQLRALENGIQIQVLLQKNIISLGVDTPEDLLAVEQRMRTEGKF